MTLDQQHDKTGPLEALLSGMEAALLQPFDDLLAELNAIIEETNHEDEER